MKKIRNNLKVIVAFVIGIIITGGTVYAANLLASDVTYDNTTSGLTSTTVQGALDELNTKANNKIASLPPKMSDMCPGCKYIYTTTEFQYGSGATALDSTLQSALKDNWEDVVTGSGKKHFLGVKVNSSTNVVEKAYACGIKDGVPFCIEGRKTADMTTDIYNANKTLLQSASLYNNGCSVGGSNVRCYGSLITDAYSDGDVYVNVSSGNCGALNNGNARCR